MFGDVVRDRLDVCDFGQFAEGRGFAICRGTGRRQRDREPRRPAGVVQQYIFESHSLDVARLQFQHILIEVDAANQKQRADRRDRGHADDAAGMPEEPFEEGLWRR